MLPTENNLATDEGPASNSFNLYGSAFKTQDYRDKRLKKPSNAAKKYRMLDAEADL